MKKIVYILFLFTASVTLLAPSSVLAQRQGFFDTNGEGGLVNRVLGCGAEFNESGEIVNECEIKHVGAALVRFINLITAFAGLEAFAMILFAGYIMFTASLTGNPDHYAMGKKTFIWAIIGLVIVMSSYVIINSVYSGLNLGGEDCSWTEPFKDCGANAND